MQNASFKTIAMQFLNKTLGSFAVLTVSWVQWSGYLQKLPLSLSEQTPFGHQTPSPSNDRICGIESVAVWNLHCSLQVKGLP